MPTPYIQKIAKQKGISVSEVEKKWDEAKKRAAEEGKSDNYAYITGIFNRMVGASAGAVNTLATDDQEPEDSENERGKIRRQYMNGLTPTPRVWFSSPQFSGAKMEHVIARVDKRIETAGAKAIIELQHRRARLTMRKNAAKKKGDNDLAGRYDKRIRTLTNKINDMTSRLRKR